MLVWINRLIPESSPLDVGVSDLVTLLPPRPSLLRNIPISGMLPPSP